MVNVLHLKIIVHHLVLTANIPIQKVCFFPVVLILKSYKLYNYFDTYIIMAALRVETNIIAIITVNPI